MNTIEVARHASERSAKGIAQFAKRIAQVAKGIVIGDNGIELSVQRIVRNDDGVVRNDNALVQNDQGFLTKAKGSERNRAGVARLALLEFDSADLFVLRRVGSVERLHVKFNKLREFVKARFVGVKNVISSDTIVAERGNCRDDG